MDMSWAHASTKNELHNLHCRGRCATKHLFRHSDWGLWNWPLVRGGGWAVMHWTAAASTSFIFAAATARAASLPTLYAVSWFFEDVQFVGRMPVLLLNYKDLFFLLLSFFSHLSFAKALFQYVNRWCWGTKWSSLAIPLPKHYFFPETFIRVKPSASNRRYARQIRPSLQQFLCLDRKRKLSRLAFLNHAYQRGTYYEPRTTEGTPPSRLRQLRMWKWLLPRTFGGWICLLCDTPENSCLSGHELLRDLQTTLGWGSGHVPVVFHFLKRCIQPSLASKKKLRLACPSQA